MHDRAVDGAAGGGVDDGASDDAGSGLCRATGRWRRLALGGGDGIARARDQGGACNGKQGEAHAGKDTTGGISSHETIGRPQGLYLMNARVADIDLLVAAHRQGVHRYLSRIVGSADAAHDLTQEVFLRVSRASVPETTAAGQRAWIFRIARNLALNHVRDARRRPEPVALVEHGAAATQEVRMAVREALAALPDLDRDVFLLRESVGLSYDEIAAACDLTAGAVRSRLHRARLALRGALGGHIDDRQSGGVRWTS